MHPDVNPRPRQAYRNASAPASAPRTHGSGGAPAVAPAPRRRHNPVTPPIGGDRRAGSGPSRLATPAAAGRLARSRAPSKFGSTPTPRPSRAAVGARFSFGPVRPPGTAPVGAGTHAGEMAATDVLGTDDGAMPPHARRGEGPLQAAVESRLTKRHRSLGAGPRRPGLRATHALDAPGGGAGRSRRARSRPPGSTNRYVPLEARGRRRAGGAAGYEGNRRGQHPPTGRPAAPPRTPRAAGGRRGVTGPT